MVPILGDLIAIPFPSWKLWGRKAQGGLFSNFCPPMDPEVRTTSALNLTLGNIADVFIWASIDGVMKSPKRCDYASSAKPRFG